MSFATLDKTEGRAQGWRERTKLSKEYGVPENERSEFWGMEDRLKSLDFNRERSDVSP